MGSVAMIVELEWMNVLPPHYEIKSFLGDYDKPSRPFKAVFVIGAFQRRDGNAETDARVGEKVIAQINADVRRLLPRRVEEHQIAELQVFETDRRPDSGLLMGAPGEELPNRFFIDHQRVTGAVNS